MTRALVIGGTGFVGVATSRELMRRGVETIASSRREQPYGTFTSHLVFDRRDEGQLRSALERVAPDVIVDLAAFQPAEVEAVIRNFRGDRYVFISTGVYPDLFLKGAAAEEDFVPLEGPVPQAPLEYREGKRWCETLLARTHDFPWVSVRPPAILGPADPTLRIAGYIERVLDGGPLLVPAESFQRQLGIAWVRDVGYLTALAADPQRSIGGRAYNVAFDGVSLEDLILSIGRALGRTPLIRPVPFAELPEGASPYGPDPRRSAGYKLTRSRRDLGFEPSQLEDALAETLAWYQVVKPSHPAYSGRAQEIEIANRD